MSKSEIKKCDDMDKIEESEYQPKSLEKMIIAFFLEEMMIAFFNEVFTDKLIICKDDSAPETIHESLPKNDDVFPIRGKIINDPLKYIKENFFSNEEDK